MRYFHFDATKTWVSTLLHQSLELDLGENSLILSLNTLISRRKLSQLA